jgi:hypothetical protein
MGEDYEILPKDEIDELRHEVEKIKKDPFGEHEKNKTLLDSMDALTEAINKLLYLFEKTQKDLIQEYDMNKPTEMLQDVLDQNEKIAKGTLAVADLVKSQKKDIDELKNTVSNPVNQLNNLPDKQNSNQTNSFPQNQNNSSLPNQQSFNNNTNNNLNLPNPGNNPALNTQGNSGNASNPFSEMPPLPSASKNKKKKKLF